MGKMARDSSPPDSPLSSMASTEAYDDDGHDYDDTTTGAAAGAAAGATGASTRPSKRQKLDAGSTASSAVVPGDAEPAEALEPLEHDGPGLEGLSDVSSDTSADIPSSPANARLDEEDYQEQVTRCEWDGCQDDGEEGGGGYQHRDMDDLVKHIHDAHIESRQKKYTCEWMSCTRKGMPHASGYALKAHMRSHTREKPFYCYLPECDRSFTRSDALAKHMRTVHETDALKSQEAAGPKSLHGSGSAAGAAGGAPSTTGKSKLKIIIKRAQSQGLEDSLDEAMNGEEHADLYTPLPRTLFTDEELAGTTEELYRKCYWEARWAEEIGESLRRECREWEEAYKKEWLEKEALVAQVIEGEIDWHTRRQAVLSGEADLQIKAAAAAAVAKGSAPPGEDRDGDRDETEEEAGQPRGESKDDDDDVDDDDGGRMVIDEDERPRKSLKNGISRSSSKEETARKELARSSSPVAGSV